ncbi:MAG: hypothetical protein ACKV0T_18985 [Planctomycetales bacterium]
MPVLYVALLIAGWFQPPTEMPPFVVNHPKTVTYYYQSPDPALGAKLLKELLTKENLEHPWFVKNDQVLILVGAALGDIATGHPEVVRDYEAAFADVPVAGRKVVLRALMNCGDKQTLEQVESWLGAESTAQPKAELRALKKHFADPERKHIRDVPAREPKELDLLWVNFFVTGEYAPVSRILDVFDLPDAKENAVLKRVARWSLASNLQQHPRLVELVQEHSQKRPPRSRKVVEEVLAQPTQNPN